MSIATIKHNPILFNSEMVRAILAGRKTQTRRLVLKSSSEVSVPWDRLEFDDSKVPVEAGFIAFADSGYLHAPTRPHPDDPQGADYWTRNRVYPRWEVGGRFWVKEDWCPLRADDFEAAPRSAKIPADRKNVAITYRADHIDPAGDAYPLEWRNARSMPRWASRITLEITDVRVEKVCEIESWDVVAEGLDSPDWHRSYDNSDGDFIDDVLPIEAYRDLWTSIYGTASWSDDWAWAITFKLIKQEPAT